MIIYFGCISAAPQTEQNLPAAAFAPHLPQNLAICGGAGAGRDVLLSAEASITGMGASVKG